MATQMTDIGLDTGEDLAINAGDFSMEESTAQHQRQLLLNNNGDFKQSPAIGVGVFDYLDDENFQNLMRAISMQFMSDGMDVKSVVLGSDGIINSDAYYP
jgi:hypothetical protein